MEKQEKQAIEILHMMCGNNGCVISDSGGKDSSVLKHIALKVKKQIRIGIQDKTQSHNGRCARNGVFHKKRKRKI